MLVQEIMSRTVVTIKTGTSVFDAASLLREKKIGCILAVDPEGTVGILTKRDIIGGTLLQHKNAETTPVSEIMNTNIITIHPLKNIEEAVDIMEKNRIKKLIVEKEGTILGIITVTDISRATKEITKRLLNSCLNMGTE